MGLVAEASSSDCGMVAVLVCRGWRVVLFVVLGTGPCNLPAVSVWNSETIQFGYGPDQQPDSLLLGRPNLNVHLSASRFCELCLDPSNAIYGSGFRVFLLMVALRYPTVNCRILTWVRLCLFSMYLPPAKSKTSEIHSLPHPENESQQRMNDFWSCIMGNLSGDLLQTCINEV